MAKLEGNSLKFTTLPPRNRCFSLLINKAACIPLIHLPVLSIVKIPTVLLRLLFLLSTFLLCTVQLELSACLLCPQRTIINHTVQFRHGDLSQSGSVPGTTDLLLTSHCLPPALVDARIRWLEPAANTLMTRN